MIIEERKVISEMDHRHLDAGELSGFVDKCDRLKGCRIAAKSPVKAGVLAPPLGAGVCRTCSGKPGLQLIVALQPIAPKK